MENQNVTVLELYNIRNLLMGFGVKGFVNEEGLSEGIKRRANKVLKIVFAELDPINKRLDELRIETDDAKLKSENIEKEKELLGDKISITIEKLDFSLIENLRLSANYQLLYDNIFINA